MDTEFTPLEKTILRAKGLSGDQIAALTQAGVGSRDDLRIVGDAETLVEIVAGIDPEIAARVMEWAVGRAPKAATATASEAASSVVLEAAGVVDCAHCGARQPKDYQTGDLCLACGKQAEPLYACFWCSSSGPGKFCRACGAAFVPTAELDLGVLLRHEGLPKDEIPKRLGAMSPEEKDLLWGRVRKMRR
ncbi:MAG TPA: hypothetical protein VGZ73_27815 [Bryobacteraceae bacterium]|jgi:hypothetical protein|nr:hypothetical protein [Bryobacteraceae bacterium]